jgi:N-dimethylarginine dimethylaminohydrolase
MNHLDRLRHFTRRGLLAVSVGLVATPQPGSAVEGTSHAAGASPATRRVFVKSEFAPLRTVVLAQCQMRLPDPASMPKEQLEEEMSIMPQDQRQIILQLLGKDHAEAMPERQQRWEAEREALKRAFEKYGVEVLRPRLLTQWEKDAGGKNGYSNSFVRDPWFTIGNAVIEGSLRLPHRRGEVLPSRDIFKREVYPAVCRYVALPQPEIMPLNVENGGPGPFLEGGDVLVYGRHVFVGNSGRASNALGAEWLRKLLASDGYTVEIVRMKPNFLHLDCVMGLVREGLVIVHEAGLIDGLPRALKDWQRIQASEEEAMNLGTNGLPITPNVYVADPAFRRIGDAVAKHGITVEYVDFAISRAFGGSFRCSTQPLWRE